MRFYPTSDINFYWEFPSSWSLYCHTPIKSWHRKALQGPHAIAHWRDLEGAKMDIIKKKDLYFKNWPYTRIREAACLPWYYCVGNRFIRLEKAFPAGFKCNTFPLNLKEVRAVNVYEKQKAKEARQKEKERKLLEKEMAARESKKSRTKK